MYFDHGFFSLISQILSPPSQLHDVYLESKQAKDQNKTNNNNKSIRSTYMYKNKTYKNIKLEIIIYKTKTSVILIYP